MDQNGRFVTACLGLVCEQELQEEDTFIAVKRLKQEQNVNKLRVKDEFRIIEPMEETDYCERVPDNELTDVLGVDPTIKNEPCKDDVIYIEKPEENEEKFFESSLRTLEKSSSAASMRPGPRGWWCPLSWRGSGTRAA